MPNERARPPLGQRGHGGPGKEARRDDQPSEGRRNGRGRERHRGEGEKSRRYSATTPAQRVREADPARLVAFETMQAVSGDDAYANLVLPVKIREAHLNKRDAGLATELTYGALRFQGTYDAIISQCVDRELSAVEPGVLNALRLGAHQLLSMRTPPHAAVNQTVALVRAVLGAGASSFANAILRRISERSYDEWVRDLVSGSSDEIRSLSLEYAHPEWITRSFRQALVAHGRPSSELSQLLDADNAAPLVNVIALPGVGRLDSVLEAGYTPSEILDGAAVLAGGDPGRLHAVREGTVRVQDVGSQLVARAVAEAKLIGSDERWLDLCAGPGGKAALWAALAAQRGAHVLANEVSDHRAKLVRQALKVVPETAWTVRVGDGRTLSSEDFGLFDRILLDAPCSGLGALRRRPEARWRKTPADVAELTKLQKELFESAVALLRPGGVLGYVTCSPHPAETVALINDQLNKNSTLVLLNSGAALDSVAKEPLASGNSSEHLPKTYRASDRFDEGASTAQLWPHRQHSDAMFLALLTKTA